MRTMKRHAAMAILSMCAMGRYICTSIISRIYRGYALTRIAKTAQVNTHYTVASFAMLAGSGNVAETSGHGFLMASCILTLQPVGPLTHPEALLDSC
jgi:hypothetical protein